ncbi:MAG TPA: hypothetical protein VGE09_08605 [Pseudoxanthomonas sp.]
MIDNSLPGRLTVRLLDAGVTTEWRAGNRPPGEEWTLRDGEGIVIAKVRADKNGVVRLLNPPAGSASFGPTDSDPEFVVRYE